MNKYKWLLIGLLIVPFLLFSQSVQQPATDTDSSHHSLIALAQEPFQTQEQLFQFDEAPQVIKRVEPKYPPTKLKERIEVSFDLKVLVDIDGNVSNAELKRPRDNSSNVIEKGPRVRDTSGNVLLKSEDFVESAIAAVRQWKFKPAKKQGKPVAAWVIVPFEFKIFNGANKQQKEDTYPNETCETIMKAVMCILKGNSYDEKIKPFINPEAYIIYEKYYESLHGVLNGEHKNINLIEGPTSVAKLWQIRMSNDETTAIIVLKTQIKKSAPTRFHTIIFMKSTSGEWKIKHWHVSW